MLLWHSAEPTQTDECDISTIFIKIC